MSECVLGGFGSVTVNAPGVVGFKCRVPAPIDHGVAWRQPQGRLGRGCRPHSMAAATLAWGVAHMQWMLMVSVSVRALVGRGGFGAHRHTSRGAAGPGLVCRRPDDAVL